MMYVYLLQRTRGFFANICNHEVAAMLALVDGVDNDSVGLIMSIYLHFFQDVLMSCMSSLAATPVLTSAPAV